MVKTRPILILLTAIVSGLAVIASFVSLLTQSWVFSKGAYVNYDNEDLAEFEYGLFKGVYRQVVPTPSVVEVSMTYLFDKNVCALLCSPNGEDAKDVLEEVYDNANANLGTSSCAQTQRAFKAFVDKNLFDTHPRLHRSSSSGKRFMNAGVVLCTIIFVVLSVVIGILSVLLSVYNTKFNPIEVYLSITGIYILNGVAFLCTFIYMLLWGILFVVTIKYNVSVQETLTNAVDTEGRASLGYSYWINFIPLIFYPANCVILFVRQYLIEKEPNYRAPVEESANPDIYIY